VRPEVRTLHGAGLINFASAIARRDLRRTTSWRESTSQTTDRCAITVNAGST